jgi:hypothetical protein
MTMVKIVRLDDDQELDYGGMADKLATEEDGSESEAGSLDDDQTDDNDD